MTIADAEMKYATLVITDASAQVPNVGFQVAATGLHQVRIVIVTTVAAIEERTITPYKVYRQGLEVVIRRRATQMEALIGTVERT